jgi:hypothetical protein
VRSAMHRKKVKGIWYKYYFIWVASKGKIPAETRKKKAGNCTQVKVLTNGLRQAPVWVTQK